VKVGGTNMMALWYEGERKEEEVNGAG